MELSPTLLTWLGMLYAGDTTALRGFPINATDAIPETWSILPSKGQRVLMSMIDGIMHSWRQKLQSGERLPAPHEWGDVPKLLAEAFSKRQLPIESHLQKLSFHNRLAFNFLEMEKPIDMDTLKRLVI